MAGGTQKGGGLWGEVGRDVLGRTMENLLSDSYLIGVLLTQVNTIVKTQQMVGYHHRPILRKS